MTADRTAVVIIASTRAATGVYPDRTGPVIAQTTVEVRPGDTEDSLHERIKAVEHPLLVNIVGRAAREGITVIDGKVSIP